MIGWPNVIYSRLLESWTGPRRLSMGGGFTCVDSWIVLTHCAMPPIAHVWRVICAPTWPGGWHLCVTSMGQPAWWIRAPQTPWPQMLAPLQPGATTSATYAIPLGSWLGPPQQGCISTTRRYWPWANKRIHVYCDNTCAVYTINKGLSKQPLVMASLRRVFWLSAIYNFRIKAVYYPGAHNILADCASRLHEPGVWQKLGLASSNTCYGLPAYWYPLINCWCFQIPMNQPPWNGPFKARWPSSPAVPMLTTPTGLIAPIGGPT